MFSVYTWHAHSTCTWNTADARGVVDYSFFFTKNKVIRECYTDDIKSSAFRSPNNQFTVLFSKERRRKWLKHILNVGVKMKLFFTMKLQINKLKEYIVLPRRHEIFPSTTEKTQLDSVIVKYVC